MGTASTSKDQANDGSRMQSSSQSSQGDSGLGSPISNEAYDVITALQAKLEGLEAYRKYARSTNATMWIELTRSDISCVERLVQSLEQLVRDDKLRMRSPGQTG